MSGVWGCKGMELEGREGEKHRGKDVMVGGVLRAVRGLVKGV